MTTYIDDNNTTSNEIELNVEALEEVIAPALLQNHNETAVMDLSVEELEEVIAPQLIQNHNETVEVDLCVEELEAVIAPALLQNHNETVEVDPSMAVLGSTQGRPKTNSGNTTMRRLRWLALGLAVLCSVMQLNLFTRVSARTDDEGRAPQGRAAVASASDNPCFAPIIISPATLPNGFVGVGYYQELTQNNGGSATFSVSAGVKPPGLNLSSQGEFAGTPTQAGSFTFTVKVTNTNGCTGARNYTVVIGNCPAISLSPGALPSATAGSSYSQQLSASGGTAPYYFSIVGGNPDGMSLSPTGVLTGPATQPGNFNFTVKATDANGCSGIKSYPISVGCWPVSFAPAGLLPTGALGTAYNQQLAPSGGAGPYTFTLNSGSTPQGVNLSSSGLLNGTPTALGTSYFQIKMTDAFGCNTALDCQLTIQCQSITINPATLPNGTVGTPYNQTFTAVGGVGTVSFTGNGGIVPPGTGLTANGIAGTPTTAGTYTFKIKAWDTNGCIGLRDYTLVIDPCISLTVAPAMLPAGQEGVAYDQFITASGGSGGYGFTISSGNLPSGLFLESYGQLHGKPTVHGTFNVTVQASVPNGCIGTQTYELVIQPGSQAAPTDTASLQSNPLPHLDDANALINVLNKNNNLYDDDGISNNSYVNWDGSAAWTNCSTFASILLKHSYGWTDSDFQGWWQSSSPNAAKYHDLIETGNRFTQIFSRSQVQAGDFIAIKYPAGSDSSGHMMLVAATPTPLYPNPTQDQLNSFAVIGTPYKVTVIDASRSYHGTTDTRHPNNGGGGEGIGKGVFVVYFDAAEQVTGYTWSTASNSTYYSQAAPAATLRHLVFGRLW